jgi:RND superfamily putative drug exporter
MRLAFTDSGNDPTKLTTRQAFDFISDGFGPGFNGPLVVAAELPGGGSRAVVAGLDHKLASVPGVARVQPPAYNSAGDAAVLIVYPTTAPQDAATASLVNQLRSTVIPEITAGTDVHVFVGGETAAGIDASSELSGRLPLVIGLVILVSFLLLMVVFRSIAIPLKAAAMNLLFTITFGLSMDYEVFLLSRIQEAWDRTGDNSGAVADGIASTGRVITAAAAIMVCVFGSFVIGDPLRILDVFGLGLAVAILVDATLVRMVLVPSIMQLLGHANWWFPRWLDRVVPHLNTEVVATQPVSLQPADNAV